MEPNEMTVDEAKEILARYDMTTIGNFILTKDKFGYHTSLGLNELTRIQRTGQGVAVNGYKVVDEDDYCKSAKIVEALTIITSMKCGFIS